MRIQTIFASLTVLYLKMIQYEKFIDSEMSRSITEALNDQRENIKAMYDKDLNLSKMGMKEYTAHSLIVLQSVEGMEQEAVLSQLIGELTILQQCLTMGESII